MCPFPCQSVLPPLTLQRPLTHRSPIVPTKPVNVPSVGPSPVDAAPSHPALGYRRPFTCPRSICPSPVDAAPTVPSSTRLPSPLPSCMLHLPLSQRATIVPSPVSCRGSLSLCILHRPLPSESLPPSMLTFPSEQPPSKILGTFRPLTLLRPRPVVPFHRRGSIVPSPVHAALSASYVHVPWTLPSLRLHGYIFIPGVLLRIYLKHVEKILKHGYIFIPGVMVAI